MNRPNLKELAEQIAVPIRHLQYLLQQIEWHIPNATVWAFGSRSKWSQRPESDLDLAIHCDKQTAQKDLPKLNDALEESDLPFKVQLLDFNRISENMQENIKKNYVVIYQPQEKILPTGWKETTLGEVLKVDELTVDNGYPFDEIEYIDIASVEERQIMQTQRLMLQEAPSRAKMIVRDNDILISTVRPNLKHYCFIKKAAENLIASTGFAVITAKKADPAYLYYLLTTNEYTAYLTQIAEGHTSAYPSFNPDVIENSVFILPPLPEQKAIAAILSSFDDKIELLRRQNKTLEKIARTTFKEWFVKFKVNGKKQKVNSSTGLPEGWRMGCLEEIVEQRVEHVSASAETEKLPYVPIDCIASKSLLLNSCKSGNEAKSSLLKFYKDDILFGAMRPYFHKVCIAPFQGTTRTTAFVLKTKEKVDFPFVVLLVFADSTIEYATTHSEGSTIPYAKWENGLNKMACIIPPKNIRIMFNDILKPLLLSVTNRYSQIQTLSKLRDALLPKLMKGEIKIKC